MKIRTLFVAVGCAASTTAVARAQEATAPQSGLEEIVVTAQKRAENLQEVPISIVSLGNEKLTDLNIDRFTDVGFTVPGLRLSQHPTTPFSTRLFIRGIGNNDAQVTQDPAVGVYVDGVYVARSTGLAFDFGDAERVEVLRGPQGTLYGRNTTGGAINIVTRRPSGEAGADVELGYGTKDYFRALGRIEFPEFAGIASSLTAIYSERDGLVENAGPGKDFGENDRWGVRFVAAADLSDNLDVFFSFDHSLEHNTPFYYQAEDVLPGFEAFVPVAPKRVKRATLAAPVEQSRLRTDGLALTLTWQPSDTLTLKSITGYRAFNASAYADFSSNPVATLFRTNRQDTDHHQFSQEIQLLGSGFDDRLQYILGGYLFSEKADQTEDYDAGSFIISNRFIYAKNKAQALFANGTWAFSEQLKLTVGGRYSWDQRRATKDNIDFTLPDPATGMPPYPFVGNGDKNFSKFNPSANISWQPADDLNLYAKVVTGYRSGGFGTGAASKEDFERGFDEENLTSFEAGVKWQGWDRRLQFNSAFFYSKYKDILIDLAVLGAPQFVASFNAGRARIYGAELDLSLLPVEAIRFDLSYAYLNAKYTEVLDPQTGADVTDLFKFPNAPKNSFSITADAELTRIDDAPLHLILNYAWQDKVVTTAPYIERPGARIGAYGLLNGRLELKQLPLGAGTVDLALWGRNLTDKAYVIDSTGSFPWSTKIKAYGEPMTLGVEARLHF
ncbi:iron complex outermembrane recepter protein [Sphingomonas laterariae]|uniref:Iron complex outermembrane recepter protein n=1 Tax=Edaphosphingomonas laterariae TaxID=861865 RepID=A0A239C817_9SPHN|nr:TonB-dependent receptor [Sphingomonas laterariae]SNS15798.1 iron complex outermembrane recepter protein [Sphingomonas laterariae]